MIKPIIIGIAGGTASGKTTISDIIFKNFKDSNSITIIKEDDYYKYQPNTTYEERTKTNYDHPLAFDHELMCEQLKELINGNKIEKPIYDFTIHNRSDKTEVIEPTKIIVIEGLFVLEEKIIRDLLDIKIFVDTPSDVRFIRRLIRDINERKRELNNIIEQYLTTVRTMHEAFIEPSKKYADIIIPNLFDNSVAVDILNTKINSIINEKMI